MHLWTDCSGPDRTVVLAICCAQLYVRQNCDTWTANWALSMLVSLSQSLTQWEGTQHAHSALYTDGEQLFVCVRQNSDTWTSNWVVGHSPCSGGVPTITLHRRHRPAARPIVFPTNNCKKAAGCRVNFSRWQNCLWRCHARCLRGLQQHGYWAIVLGSFLLQHIFLLSDHRDLFRVTISTKMRKDI